MTKYFSDLAPLNAMQQSSATPVQFLPSAMLSWRMPIMVVSGLPATAGSKPKFVKTPITKTPIAALPKARPAR